MKIWMSLALLSLIIGCGPETRSYRVNVNNQSLEPMTLWLAKEGGPLEMTWLSPEDIAVMRVDKGTAITGVTVPPGKSATMGPINGKFEGGANAVLRVYRGQRKFDELLSIGADSPNRTDLPLQPGDNQFVIGPDGKVNKP
ncbi:MAG TPA: hypothetical protein VGB55_04315 [Tepidisphaeraceae bacterium]